MTNDFKEKQPLSPSSFTSKKWQKRKTAVAISMATCLFFGIIGYEIVRDKEPLLEYPQENSLLFPSPSYDEDLIAKYNESLQKVKELKKLLFYQERAPQNTKILELQNLIKEKEQAITDLSNKLENEIAKNSQHEDVFRKVQEEKESLIASFEEKFALLQRESEKEKALAIANLEEKIHNERKTVESINAEFEKTKHELMASLDQRLQEQTETIKNLQAQNEDDEDLYHSKDLALQATENAWRDYALDLSQELQTLEKEFAVIEERKFFDDQEYQRLSKKIDTLEAEALHNSQFSQFIGQELEKIGKLYTQLEEKFYLEKVLAFYLHESPKSEITKTLEQLTSDIQMYRKEAFVANEALAIEKKVSDTLYEDLNLYLAKSQELNKQLQAAHQSLQNKDLTFLELQDNLAQAQWQLEESQMLFKMQLALVNEIFSKDLAHVQSQHEKNLESANEALANAVMEKSLIEDTLTSLQKHYELAVANQEKTASEIIALHEEKKALEEMLAKSHVELEQVQAKQMLQIENFQTSLRDLTNQLEQELAKQEKMENEFEREKRSLTENLASLQQDLAILENQLASGITAQEESRLLALEEKNNLLKEIELANHEKTQMEENLQHAHAKYDELQERLNESYAFFNNDKIRLMQEIEAHHITSNHLESKLQNSTAKYEATLSELNEKNAALENNYAKIMDEIEFYKLTSIQLEEELKEVYAQKNELINVVSSGSDEFAIYKSKIEDLENQLQSSLSPEKKEQLYQEMESYKLISQKLESKLLDTERNLEDMQAKAEEIDAYKLEIVQLEEKLADSFSEQKNLENEVAELKGLSEKDHSLLREASEDILAYQDTIADIKVLYRQRLDAIKAESEVLNNELANAKEQNDSIKKRLLQEKSALETKIQGLQDEIAHIKENQVHKLEEQITRLQEDLEQKQKEHEDSLTAIQLLKEDIASKDISYENLNEFLIAQTAHVSNLQKKLDDEVERNKAITSELITLQNNIHEKEKLLIELTERENGLKLEEGLSAQFVE